MFAPLETPPVSLGTKSPVTTELGMETDGGLKVGTSTLSEAVLAELRVVERQKRELETRLVEREAHVVQLEEEMERVQTTVAQQAHENAALQFSVDRLTKRCTILMDKLRRSSSEIRKKNANQNSWMASLFTGAAPDSSRSAPSSRSSRGGSKLKEALKVTRKELRAKILENERVHMDMFELQQTHTKQMEEMEAQLQRVRAEGTAEAPQMQGLEDQLRDLRERLVVQEDTFARARARFEADVEKTRKEMLAQMAFADQCQDPALLELNLAPFDSTALRERAKVVAAVMGVVKKMKPHLVSLARAFRQMHGEKQEPGEQAVFGASFASLPSELEGAVDELVATLQRLVELLESKDETRPEVGSEELADVTGALLSAVRSLLYTELGAMQSSSGRAGMCAALESVVKEVEQGAEFLALQLSVEGELFSPSLALHSCAVADEIVKRMPWVVEQVGEGAAVLQAQFRGVSEDVVRHLGGIVRCCKGKGKGKGNEVFSPLTRRAQPFSPLSTVTPGEPGDKYFGSYRGRLTALQRMKDRTRAYLSQLCFEAEMAQHGVPYEEALQNRSELQMAKEAAREVRQDVQRMTDELGEVERILAMCGQEE